MSSGWMRSIVDRTADGVFAGDGARAGDSALAGDGAVTGVETADAETGGESSRLVRLLALASVLVLLAAPVRVLYGVLDVVADPTPLLAVVVVTALAATLVARFVPARYATVIGAMLLAGGLGWHMLTLPTTPTASALLVDVLEYVTGRSVLQILHVGKWVLGVAPAPVFVTWYFGLRRRYGLAVLTAGTTLGFFVLSGDAAATTTLVGVVGGALTFGFGELDRRAGRLANADVLVVVAVAMVLVPTTVTVLPSAAATPVRLPVGESSLEGDVTPTLETSLVSNEQRVRLQGTISLSTEKRFTVHSTDPGYWRVGAYDRYTGQGWVRTGDSRPIEGDLPDPPGPTETVRQRYRLAAPIEAVPSVWRPVELRGDVSTRTRRTALGGLQPADTLPKGTEYGVVSERPVVNRSTLEQSGTDYPRSIERRYLQVPSTMPDRVATLASNVTGDATTPYEKARRVQAYLQAEKGYSLDVQRPDDHVVSNFLFEMDAGYCTYFASSMAVLLRTQGVPARVVTGYTPGEQVGDDEWVVRGLQSHMWVEVYVPDVGWVRFDPTPASSRIDAENERLRAAGLGTNGTDSPLVRSTFNDTNPSRANLRANRSARGQVQGPSTPAGGAGPNPRSRPQSGSDAESTPSSGSFNPFTTEDLAMGLAVLAVAAVLGRRTGTWRRLRERAAIHWQFRGTPTEDVRRAFDRLELLLARRYRPRRPGESVRTYLDAIGADERTRHIARVRERAVYGDGDVSQETADDVVRLMDDLSRE